MRIWAVAAVALAASGSAAMAADRNATNAIMMGDYATAERTLTSELRTAPAQPELMLNLAAVYRQTGRDAQARALYTEVLARRDVLMDLRDDRTASSHAIAQLGLRSLSQVAAR